jgi:hypothetical protein
VLFTSQALKGQVFPSGNFQRKPPLGGILCPWDGFLDEIDAFGEFFGFYDDFSPDYGLNNAPRR